MDGGDSAERVGFYECIIVLLISSQVALRWDICGWTQLTALFISSSLAWDVIYGSSSRYAAVELQLQFLPFHFHSPLLVLLCRFQRYLLVCCSTCIKLIHNKIMKTRSSISTVHMCIFTSSSRITCLFCNCAPPLLHCEPIRSLVIDRISLLRCEWGFCGRKDEMILASRLRTEETRLEADHEKVKVYFTTAPAQSHHSTVQRDNNLKQFPA